MFPELELLIENGFNPHLYSEEDLMLLQLAMTRPKTPDELWDYVKLFFNVEIPRKKVCEKCSAPFDAFCLAQGTKVTTVDGEIAIEKLNVGDKVLTRKGWKAVTHVTYMGDKPTIKLKMSNGRTLICTEDHYIWSATQNKFVTAGSLSFGETLSAPVLNHPSVLTNSTFTSSTFLLNNKVLTLQGMTHGALCAATPFNIPSASFSVLACTNNLHVQDVLTARVEAEVVDSLSVCERSDVGNPYQTMSANTKAISRDFSATSFSIPLVGFTSVPNEARGAIVERVSADVCPSCEPVVVDSVPASYLRAGDAPEITRSSSSVAQRFVTVDAVSSGFGSGPCLFTAFVAESTFTARGDGNATRAITSLHIDCIDYADERILPTYDIGVGDCHEFYAEGALVHNCASYFAYTPLTIWWAARGSGKLSRLSTPILTPTGWKTMGDMQVGSEVFDLTGLPRKVTAVHPQGKKKIYKVSFNDGTSTECGAEHLWRVSEKPQEMKRHYKVIGRTADHKKIRKYEPQPKEYKWVVKDTQTLMGDLTQGIRKDWKWRIPITAPVQFPKADLLLDPYLLGSLLGDGGISQHAINFTTADEESAVALAVLLPDSCKLNKLAAEYGYSITSRTLNHGSNSVREALRHYNLLGTNSWTKFIPKEYLYGSVEQRLYLLQGLLDTDGHSNETGIDFCIASPQLMTDTIFLVQTLGGTAKICKPRVVNGVEYVRSRFKLPINPFRLPRKKDAWVEPTKYPVTRIIVGIEEIGEDEAQCITVDSPTSTYLTNDCIVTHNSVQLALLSMVEQVTLAGNIVLLGGSGEQAKRLIAYLRGNYSHTRGMFWSAEYAPKALIDHTTENKSVSKLYNGGNIEALMASPKSIRGKRCVRLRIDETDEVDIEQYDDAIGIPQGDFKRGILQNITSSSTWHHPNKCMTEVMRRYRDAAPGTQEMYTWCWREILESNGGWMPDADMETKRQQQTKERFDMEYNNKEPQGEGRIFLDAAVDKVFNIEESKEDPGKQIFTKGNYKGAVADRIRIEDPQEGAVYYHGADWAQTKDSTVFVTFKKQDKGKPDVLVNWERYHKQPWGVVIARFNDITSEYGGTSSHDCTGGGQVIGDLISSDSIGVDFRQRKLITDIFTDYIIAIENGEISMPYIEHAYFEHKWLTFEQAYGKDHAPDSFVAGALAWSCRNRGTFQLLMCRPC
jgi:hypothetical protein